MRLVKNKDAQMGGVSVVVPRLLGAFKRGTAEIGRTMFIDGGGTVLTTAEREGGFRNG